MTTATITVSLGESPNETYEAEYFQVEDGWMMLKTGAGKLVASFPQSRVTRVLTTMSPFSATSQQAIIDGEAPEVVFACQSQMQAWEEGFGACAKQFANQKADPTHPFIRINPYAEARAKAAASAAAKWSK